MFFFLGWSSASICNLNSFKVATHTAHTHILPGILSCAPAHTKTGNHSAADTRQKIQIHLLCCCFLLPCWLFELFRRWCWWGCCWSLFLCVKRSTKYIYVYSRAQFMWVSLIYANLERLVRLIYLLISLHFQLQIFLRFSFSTLGLNALWLMALEIWIDCQLDWIMNWGHSPNGEAIDRAAKNNRYTYIAPIIFSIIYSADSACFDMF